ncbi:MAG TPA: class I SAM-dependent methyltransferase [Solirubrobacteraceae bacterium]|nr:class I SAM-dependent methyltransferase [Solirubrobacteraceae bacterium]
MGRLYDATWGRGFAALYDRMLAATEDAGLRDRRRALLSQARGSTLELGAGTGLNLDLYPDAVTELVLTEPFEHMATRLRARAREQARPTEVVEAPAERLPFPDDRFDTVAATLVLCTVDDPERTLAEVDRVLKPGGRFLFLEHVRSTDPRTARWQDRLHGPWRFVGAGCHCNRDTPAALEASPLHVDALERAELPKAPPITRPLISGHATAAA